LPDNSRVGLVQLLVVTLLVVGPEEGNADDRQQPNNQQPNNLSRRSRDPFTRAAPRWRQMAALG